MGLIEKWNVFAKKKIYINDHFEIGVGRVAFMILLNIFISIGMIVTGTTAPSLVWLWVDLMATLKQSEKK